MAFPAEIDIQNPGKVILQYKTEIHIPVKHEDK